MGAGNKRREGSKPREAPTQRIVCDVSIPRTVVPGNQPSPSPDGDYDRCGRGCQGPRQRAGGRSRAGGTETPGACRASRSERGDVTGEQTTSGGAGTKRCPAMAYFLDPRRTNIIGAEGLTAVFGMGTGVALPLWSPGKCQVMPCPARSPADRRGSRTPVFPVPLPAGQGVFHKLRSAARGRGSSPGRRSADPEGRP